MAIKEEFVGTYECVRGECLASWTSNSGVIRLSLPADNGREQVRFPAKHLDDLLDLLMEISNHKSQNKGKSRPVRRK